MDKPAFNEGQPVEFEIGGLKGTGRIRGLALSHIVDFCIVDFWIVEVVQAEGLDPKTYPWSCITLPHGCLKALSAPPIPPWSRNE